MLNLTIPIAAALMIGTRQNGAQGAGRRRHAAQHGRVIVTFSRLAS
jgi:hypothetical protein